VLALAKTAAGPGRFALVERPLPALGPHEVAIDVAACGICGSDLHMLHGSLPAVEATLPVWLGHEYAGRVGVIGDGVEGLRVGDLVTAEPSAGCGHCARCRAGRPNLCPGRRYDGGGFAASVVVPAARVHRLPDGVGAVVGALFEPLACAAHGVIEVAQVQAGETVVVIGPGPIGALAALVARARGAWTLALGRASSEGRLDFLRAHGMVDAVAMGYDDARRELEQRTDGGRASVVIGCAGGGDAIRLGLELLARGGRYVELGLGGVADGIDVSTLVQSELRVMGSVSHTPASWRTALELVRDGRVPLSALEPMITLEEPLERWREAFEAAASKRHMKVVLVPGPHAAEGGATP
jgi:L-iditol 2-dehydrogenase